MTVQHILYCLNYSSVNNSNIFNGLYPSLTSALCSIVAFTDFFFFTDCSSSNFYQLCHIVLSCVYQLAKLTYRICNSGYVRLCFSSILSFQASKNRNICYFFIFIMLTKTIHYTAGRKETDQKAKLNNK